MNEESAGGQYPPLGTAVGSSAKRKLRAEHRRRRGLWAGIGILGIIGWSITVPTLIGTAVGRWLDAHHAGNRSWTLTLLVAGLLVGCALAYHWVANEQQAIQREDADA